MIFLKQNPSIELSAFIKSFWIIDSEDDTTIGEEKIIPDGYPEMIFHYKSHYLISINNHWEKQSNYLIAGQISNSFYLKNSGKTGIFAIKFMPSALYSLFDIEMDTVANKVVAINNKLKLLLKPVIEIAISNISFEKKVKLIEKWFVEFIIQKQPKNYKLEQIIQLIIENNGKVTLEELSKLNEISKRSLERYFKKHVGISPKFYIRIVRFSHIFKLIQNKDFDWSDVSFLAGYYDQSHFIKNFKEFTGENPSDYGFNNINMANFFLKK